MDEVTELLQFLDIKARLDLKAVALTHVLSLTASAEGKSFLSQNVPFLHCVTKLTGDESEAIAKDACRALINLSAEEEGAKTLLEQFPSTDDDETGIIQLCLKHIIDRDSALADLFCAILSNLSRHENLVETVIDAIEGQKDCISRLVTCYTTVKYNSKGAKLDYLGPIFSNLSQHSRGRGLICNKSLGFFQRILPFTHFKESVVRRGGAVGLLKNICFDTSLHEWLLSPKVDVLPFILLPLAGPEEFTEDENDKLPAECQFLPPDQEREIDPDIRLMLLESLAQLCATRKGREYLRNHGAYLILRELHKWECTAHGDKKTLVACENVVDILIRTEEELGEENLKHVEIPEHLVEKFKNLEDT